MALLPFNENITLASDAFIVTNNDSTAISGHSQNGAGIVGGSTNGPGVDGHSSTDSGVFGSSTKGNGVTGRAKDIDKAGIFGVHMAGGTGVVGLDQTKISENTGIGVFGYSEGGKGVVGANEGVKGDKNNQPAILGMSTNGNGIQGISKSSDAITAVSFGSGMSGVYGNNDSSDGFGVSGASSDGIGIHGESTTNVAIQAKSVDSKAIHAESENGFTAMSVVNNNGTFALYALNNDKGGVGIIGSAVMMGMDLDASNAKVASGSKEALIGLNVQDYMYGITVEAETTGVESKVQGMLNGLAIDQDGSVDCAIYGEIDKGTGVKGVINKTTGYAIHGVTKHREDNTYAGRFDGDVLVTGDLRVNGNVYKHDINFKIDHPLAPGDKYLVHSGIESSERKNIYDGRAILDAKGEAVIKLPEWFQALNEDFRYQLTPIGSACPNLFISREVKNNEFTIAGGKPKATVCWQVSGVRKDNWAKAHPMKVEVDKRKDEKGRYIHPELFGKSDNQSVDIFMPQTNSIQEFEKFRKDLESKIKAARKKVASFGNKIQEAVTSRPRILSSNGVKKTMSMVTKRISNIQRQGV